MRIAAVPLFLLLAGLALRPVIACDNSSANIDEVDPAQVPQIISVAGPAGGGVRCHPADTGGNCPLPITVTFRLPKDQFVTRAVVAFQGDGSDVGVDRYYAVPNTFGEDGADVVLAIDADIPTTILRQNALFTYTVRLITGTGAKSVVTTLTISVT